MRIKPILYCDDSQAADVLVLTEPHHFGFCLVSSRIFQTARFVCWHCVVDDFGALVPVEHLAP